MDTILKGSIVLGSIVLVGIIFSIGSCENRSRALYLSEFIPTDVNVSVWKESRLLFSEDIEEKRIGTEMRHIIDLDPCDSYIVHVNDVSTEFSTCNGARTFVLILHDIENPYIITEFDRDYWIRD